MKEDGTFSCHGMWSGFEWTSVGVTWSQRGVYVHLTGVGSMHADFGGFSDRAFETRFSLLPDGALVSGEGAPGWSLLDNREPLLPVPSDIARLTDQI